MFQRQLSLHLLNFVRNILSGIHLTTVAANKSQIACDLQATHNGGLKFKLTTKIVHIDQPLVYPYPFYVGLCGNTDSFGDIISWLSDPEKWKKPPKGNGGDFLVLTEDKKLFTFASPSQWLPVNQPFYAVGSGMNYAMAAMEAGKTPLQACKIAAKFDPMTGMGFKKIDL